jgi:two-component system, OmpR family, sensor kinase
MTRADGQLNDKRVESANTDAMLGPLDRTLLPSTLTARQREIVTLIAQGLTNEQIAERLVLASGTAANHVASILERLNLTSRTQIATWAVEHGLSGSQDRLLTALERLLDVQPATLAGAMSQAATLIAEVLGADKVDAFLHEQETDTLVAVGASNTPMAHKQRTAGLDRQPIANGGRVVDVFQTGAAYLDGHVEQDVDELLGVKRTLGVRSQMNVPLVVAGIRSGVLSAQALAPDAFSERDLRFLQAVSRWVGNVAHRAELSERNAAAAVEQGRRMAADELVTVLAHDLRNYLSPMRGRVGLLRQRALREQHEANVYDVQALDQAVDQLARLISELLDVARIDQGLFELNAEPTDVVAVARQAAEAVQDPATPIQLSAPPEVRVVGDPARLRQALENVLANAVQHAPLGTVVRLEVTEEQHAEGLWAMIRVSDEGPGIDPTILPRLFERFARSSSSMGLGIGLYLARQIAEAHDGTLEVTSSPGAGTHFRLSIPAESIRPTAK